jgi:UDP-N-acetylmuramate--alanine ligase
LIQLSDIQKVYFIGIGGIGMSALARYFHTQGISVSGYDKTPTQLTKLLEESGISIHYDDDTDKLSKDVQLVVYTPAVPKNHLELNYYLDNGYTVMKRSEVLGLISHSSFNICVAGTHGKTTITTMIAHILRDSGYGCNAFLGGIASNYNTNFWSNKRNVSVIEADEYDRSFLRLSPDIAVISAMDPDHLDIYGTEEVFRQAFIDFSHKVKTGGLLLSRFALKGERDMRAENHLTYSLQNDSADIHAGDIRMNNGSYTFNVIMKDQVIYNITLNMGGMHNVENMIAAITVAAKLGIDHDSIRLAVESFKGVKRRFEYIVKKPGIVFIDDYAHHPEELKALLTGAKTLFKGRRCTIVFQPHLFSRTRDFADGFAESLDLADQVILLPIYPARELPMEGVTSELILGKMKNEQKQILSKEELPAFIEQRFIPGMNAEFGELLILAGAGDIDTLVAPVKKMIEENL